MIQLIIICTSVVMCYGMYLFHQYKDPYTDEIVESTKVVNSGGDVIGRALLIKRTYKNGKTIFVNKRYG